MNTLNNYKKTLLTATLSTLLAACGGGSSGGEQTSPPPPPPASTSATFSLGLSDAPVDSADAVFIQLDQIVMTKSESESEDTGERDEVIVDQFVDGDGNEVDTIQVNLLDYQGSAQVKIIDETQNILLDQASYSMELVVIDEGSYVLLNDDTTQHEIKVPSSRLKLGEFSAQADLVQVNETPAYTIEFDLRQSLVLRGNLNNNNGFIIKPEGVRIVSQYGNLQGTVASQYTNIGECTVYLYDEAATEFADMHLPDDESFETPDEAITGSAPLASTVVNEDSSYSIGFISAGNYQVALSCGNDADDNIQYDGLTIPSVADITPDVAAVTITEQSDSTINFE